MGVDPIGYLVFCKSRGLCHEFYPTVVMINQVQIIQIQIIDTNICHVLNFIDISFL